MYVYTYAQSPKKIFRPFEPQSGLKIRGGAGPPGPLPYFRHCCITKGSVPFQEQMKSSTVLQIEALNLFHIHQFY